MKWLFAVLLLVSASAHSDDLTVNAIIERSVAATDADWKAAPDYDCELREQDVGGNKTYDQLMILGSPYRRLVAINEEPLSPRAASKSTEVFANQSFVKVARNRVAMVDGSRGIDPPVGVHVDTTRRVATPDQPSLRDGCGWG